MKMKLLMWKLKRQPFVSISLVVINVIVYLLCLIFEEMYQYGACGIWEVFQDKEYGRILWSMFLHADAEHIFSNMILVAFLGSMLEREIGHLTYGIIYFISGIGGNLVSLLYNLMRNDYTVSIGASGAVFGLDGLLIAMVLFLGERMRDFSVERVVVVVLLSLYSGFTHSGIDNAAHLGGLLVGFLSGIVACIIIRRLEDRNRRTRR